MLPVLLFIATEAVTRLDGSRVTFAAIDQHIESAMQQAHVTGLGLAVVQHGKIRYQKTFGNAEGDRKLTVDSVMYGASLTKAMFAYALMHLVEEGKLDLDRSIAAYLRKPLPDYPKYADLAGDDRWKKLTIGILMSHTAGFANFRFLEPDGKLKFHFEPGTRYAYSGEGINLAQFVIEDMGIDAGQLFQTHVLDRFGMKRSGPVWRDEFLSDLAVGHLEDGKPVGHNKRGSVRAAGSMDTTLADFTRFTLGISRRDGLTRKTWAAMFRPRIRIHTETQFPSLNETRTTKNDAIQLAYGIGWGVFQTPAGRAVFKEGHDDGWENHAVCFDKRRTCLVLMSNSSNADKTYRDLLDFIIGDHMTADDLEGIGPLADHVTKRADVATI